MDPKKLPFDGMRMFWGGFKSIVELSLARSPPDRRSARSATDIVAQLLRQHGGNDAAKLLRFYAYIPAKDVARARRILRR